MDPCNVDTAVLYAPHNGSGVSVWNICQQGRINLLFNLWSRNVPVRLGLHRVSKLHQVLGRVVPKRCCRIDLQSMWRRSISGSVGVALVLAVRSRAVPADRRRSKMPFVPQGQLRRLSRVQRVHALRAGNLPVGCRVERLHELRLGTLPIRFRRQRVRHMRGWDIPVPRGLNSVLRVRPRTVPGLVGSHKLLEVRGGEVSGQQRTDRVPEV